MKMVPQIQLISLFGQIHAQIMVAQLDQVCYKVLMLKSGLELIKSEMNKVQIELNLVA